MELVGSQVGDFASSNGAVNEEAAGGVVVAIIMSGSCLISFVCFSSDFSKFAIPCGNFSKVEQS